MKDYIWRALEESLLVKKNFVATSIEQIVECGEILARSLASGHKIILFGNGGSAADAQHIAAEFVNRFELERTPLPAMALTTDTSVITSIANDYAFDEIFAKQIIALGNKDDIAWGISTSGNSTNVIKGLEAARARGMITLGLSGRDGGKMNSACDLSLVVPGNNTARIQEAHIFVGHVLCAIAERILFS